MIQLAKATRYWQRRGFLMVRDTLAKPWRLVRLRRRYSKNQTYIKE